MFGVNAPEGMCRDRLVKLCFVFPCNSLNFLVLMTPVPMEKQRLTCHLVISPAPAL